jgi:hypothetical protein
MIFNQVKLNLNSMINTKKILIVTGDAGESFEILYASHRLRETGYEVITRPCCFRVAGRQNIYAMIPG